ncbi:saccharopine dehydrogenase NADP-binding domain-containing protein [Actinokineospora auranticolor]|uniref:Saccharopine dehydrogenase (NAD+, L-glutamate forming) n=1 Tax=Actinokineospora auranticolor TaxID=155976 RepID=A0A2S6GWY3_9PSEU|nr:saccharopine dehydrogenase NADP-binding domain-containing protein [Actinokineospora auranticolor]PPK69696.1 saccharopine dehydrogenase (NAD+, L-glutamate forming) [Actinokineospora auranticolor]
MLDIVLFGATGFTGGLTAEYLARHAPPTLRWAIAGRDRAKLAAVRDRLGLPELELLVADAGDPASLKAVAESTRVVVSTVGPYLTHGEPLVAACAEAGTDYLDLTGEPEFVDRVYLGHHARAVETGARIVHSAGFDSIPYDLGVYFTVKQLPRDVPITVEGFFRASAAISGGTFHSAVLVMSRLREASRLATQRRRAEGRPAGRRVRGMKVRPRRVDELALWGLPAPTIDPLVVLRSARALESYGPDFRYGHYLGIKRLPSVVGLVGGVAAVAGLAQVPFTRDWLLSRREAGTGPSPEQRAKSWFKVTFLARAGTERITTEVTGGDPGYDETAKMLGESALCLALDDLPATAGQVTTAVAMGDALLDRLVAAGIRFAVR